MGTSSGALTEAATCPPIRRTGAPRRIRHENRCREDTADLERLSWPFSEPCWLWVRLHVAQREAGFRTSQSKTPRLRRHPRGPSRPLLLNSSDSPGRGDATERNYQVLPNPYKPQYNTIAELVRDSGAIVLGSLQGSPAVTRTKDGSVIHYPINVQQNFGAFSPRTVLTVSSTEVTAAKLSLSGTYIFFWTVIPRSVLRPARIVGGIRGVMAYDASTDTVTRLASNATSQIPRSQTLEQFNRSVPARSS